LFQADSAFYCGTAAEVVGIASVDDYQFPKTGTIPWVKNFKMPIHFW
jgi:branched-subunit amino acid aminotransferase/4-amino-4-deoxychorismate lyase